MNEIKGIRIVSLAGEKEYGIEDSEVREELANVVDGAPETFDTLKEIADWIAKDETGAVALANAISANAKAINTEVTRAEQVEQAIKEKAVDADSLNFKARADVVALNYKTIEEVGDEITIPAATTSAAGVMSAVDKRKLDNVPSTIEDAIAEESKATDEKIAKEKVRAEQAEQDLANDIAKAPNLALRALFIAAGAEYNDSGADKTKTAPWGETVTHKAGHYYLNGLGDITEEQMSEIYTSDKFWISKDARGFLSGYKVRTNITARAAELFRSYAYDFSNSVYECPNLEVLVLCNPASSSDTYRTITISRFSESLYSVRKLKRIFGILNLRSTTTTNLHATVLEHINILGLMCNLNISKTGVISKESVLYMIQKAAPTSEITITLHADAYARLANNADIVAALEAQPLITLVSA